MKLFFRPHEVGKALLATGICVALLQVATAQVMSSTNYKIQSDSINVGGGTSTSTNFGMESTVGEAATGISSSTNYQLRAGYQQMQEVYLSMTVPSSVTMSPSLGGLTGGISTGSTSVVVVTDSPAGYQITIKASSSPAMRSGVNTIADYAPGGGVPDFAFVNNSTSVSFAFSPEGTNLATRYKDNGATCGVGVLDTTQRCWDGLSTTDRTIVNATAANQPAGATTTIRFQVGIGGSVAVPQGTYTATTTITALPL
jgi:hypothetical protein